MTTPQATDRTRWLALAAKALKDGSIDSLARTTQDGIVLPALAIPDPDAPPLFLPRPASLVGRDWDLRVLVDAPDPEDANAELLVDLSNGATSLRIGLGCPERAGVILERAADLDRALSGVPLDRVPVALDAGFMGAEVAEWLAAAAREAPAARLAFHLDPIGAYAEGGTAPDRLEDLTESFARAAVRLAAPYPRASLFLASARVVHEAGGSDAEELGFAAAAALAYAKALVAEGLSMREAFDRIVIGLSLDAELFGGIAKLRAARLIWNRLTEACEASGPARIEARSSRRMLARQDAWTNLLRQSAAAFAGAVGGADAVMLDVFTEAQGRTSAFARRQARNIQLVLMEEAGLGRVADPASGAWLLDGWTRELARAGWEAFQAIERAGGVAQALRSGQIAADGTAVLARRQADLRQGRAEMVGVTRFKDPAPRPAPSTTCDRPTVPPPARSPEVDRCLPLTPVRLAAPFEAEQA